jgi:hypothetical protein
MPKNERNEAAEHHQRTAKSRRTAAEKNEEDRELSEELEMSFPASDPPSSTQPGSGITGAEPPPPGVADVKRRTARPS